MEFSSRKKTKHDLRGFHVLNLQFCESIQAWLNHRYSHSIGPHIFAETYRLIPLSNLVVVRRFQLCRTYRLGWRCHPLRLQLFESTLARSAAQNSHIFSFRSINHQTWTNRLDRFPTIESFSTANHGTLSVNYCIPCRAVFYPLTRRCCKVDQQPVRCIAILANRWVEYLRQYPIRKYSEYLNLHFNLLSKVYLHLR